MSRLEAFSFRPSRSCAERKGLRRGFIANSIPGFIWGIATLLGGKRRVDLVEMRCDLDRAFERRNCRYSVFLLEIFQRSLVLSNGSLRNGQFANAHNVRTAVPALSSGGRGTWRFKKIKSGTPVGKSTRSETSSKPSTFTGT